MQAVRKKSSKGYVKCSYCLPPAQHTHKETFGGDGYVHYLDNFFKVKLEEAEKGGTEPVKVTQKY